MRALVKVVFYAAVAGALCWLVPQIAASFDRATAAGSTPDASRAYGLFSLYLIVGAALAMLVAWDISQFLGWQAEKLFLGGGRLSRLTPTWWKADRLRKEENADEAVRVLREAFEAHPRQWRLGVRIAEIYQHDLNNPLAAALEYEDILKRRLPRPARAWLLVRLATCYLLLKRLDDAAAKLREVKEKFPRTPAAEKAGRRLARMESLSAES